MNSLPETLQTRLKACRTLPSAPSVVLQVLDLCQDEEVSIGQVAKVLIRDPALSGKILKVANSPWYGVRSQVTTLERAITIIGVNATLSLALSFSLVRGLQKGKAAGFDHQAYWKRCVVAAGASRVIGLWASAASHDELFLGGLLQDIGILALNEAIPEEYGRLIVSAKDDHERLLELEQQELGSDHAAVGEWLLARWNLPANLQLAAASSHGGHGNPAELSIFSKCVALANYIAGIWIQSDTAAATARAREQSIALFDMSSEQFEKILNDIAHVLPEVTANLEINIGGDDFVDRILDQARGALVELSLHAYRIAQEFQMQAQRDELTSLSNRAYLNSILPRHFSSARDLGQSLSVVFVDVDNFKSINDIYGHQTGDQVLSAVAQILRSCTREMDIVSRYGGDEFVILLSDISAQVTSNIGKRIQQSVMQHSHVTDGGMKISVTVSVGCATMDESSTFSSAKELLEAADRCLYAAKSGGRNRVIALDQIGENAFFASLRL
jgi:diguanylate cyclase (GGDEF)-like protein